MAKLLQNLLLQKAGEFANHICVEHYVRGAIPGMILLHKHDDGDHYVRQLSIDDDLNSISVKIRASSDDITEAKEEFERWRGKVKSGRSGVGAVDMLSGAAGVVETAAGEALMGAVGGVVAQRVGAAASVFGVSGGGAAAASFGSVAQGLMQCTVVTGAIVVIVKEIVAMHQAAKANKRQCERLVSRIGSLQHPLAKLEGTLKSAPSGPSAKLSTEDVFAMFAILHRIQTTTNDAKQIIESWTKAGSGFFGKLKKYLGASKFGEEFDRVRKLLKDQLADLQGSLVIHTFLGTQAVLPVGAFDESAADAAAADADKKELPDSVSQIGGGNIKQLLEQVQWSAEDLYQRMSAMSITISKDLSGKLGMVVNNQAMMMGNQGQMMAKQEEILHILRVKQQHYGRLPVVAPQANELQDFANEVAGRFWVDHIKPHLTPGVIGFEWDGFCSALFNVLLYPEGVDYSDFARIAPQLKSAFDTNKDGKVDIFEYKRVTAEKDPVEICQQMLRARASGRGTMLFTKEMLSSATKLGPKYPPASKEQQSLIDVMESGGRPNSPDIRRIFSDTRIRYAFSVVPRGFFMPDYYKGAVYEDSPIATNDRKFHQSAPHMYLYCLEMLEISVNDKTASFLNVGSGTGYLNTLIAVMQGWNGINHGVEIQADTVEESKKSVGAFAKLCEVPNNNIRIYPGNVFKAKLPLAEGYDRIYVGAGCLRKHVSSLQKLLSPNGGKMLVPIQESKSDTSQTFTQIMRQGQHYQEKKCMGVRYVLLQE